MKSPNKIRERDMDSEFLLSLKSGIASEDAARLLADYLRRDDTIDMSQIPKEYTDYIKALISSGISDSGFTAITEDLLDDNLKNLLNRVRTSLDNSDQDDDTRDALISDLQALVTAQQSQITSLINQLEVLRTQIINFGSDVSLQAKIDTAIEQSLARVESGVYSYGNRLLTVENDIKQIKNTFNDKTTIQLSDLNPDLQEKINSISTFDTRIYNLAVTGMIKGEVKPGQWLRYNSSINGVVNSADMIIRAAVCYNETELAAEQARNTEQIITVYDSRLYTRYDDNGTYAYDYTSLANNEHNDKFIFDINSEMLLYVINNGGLTKMSNNSLMIKRIGVETKIIELGAGESIKVDREGNLEKLPISVQIKDTVEDSRTLGQYINSEGIITVMNDIDSYTLYNDADIDVEVKVLIPNFIESTSFSANDYEAIKDELKAYVDSQVTSGIPVDVDLSEVENRITAIEKELYNSSRELKVGDE